MTFRPSVRLPVCASVLLLAACAGSSTIGSAGAPAPDMSMSPPNPDPRVGLRAGWMDAAEAIWNLRVVSKTPPSKDFFNPSTPGDRRLTNSDLAFLGKYAIQGNYSGWQVWDIGNPSRPRLHKAYVCPGSQSDVSVYRDLLFVSGEATSGRLDCGLQGVPDSVSHDRLRGIRIFDITDITAPRYLGNVQTCRGSHTHTVVTDPNDAQNVYIYVSGSAPVRSPSELPGCSGAPLDEDPNTALFRIEVIRIPLANPGEATIVSSPRIFQDLGPPPRRTEPGTDSARAQRRRSGPTQCHDITVYPAIGLAGGACGGYGLLLDIRDVANPKRIGAVADTNFSFWHSATFSNDGSKVLFTDEWGGGTQPRCRATDKYEWGANAIFTLADNRMTFKSYYKMPAAQTPFENCVAHNGSLIPIPGRDVMVQGWYQGGISIFDWTDPAQPKEIAYFDRGPMDSTRLLSAGSWSVYWYNGVIVSSEIARGLDILELVPSAFLTQNEIDAAKTVRFEYLNAQEQPKMVWPPSFALARAFLDQLERGRGLAPDRIAAAR
ncbi:MAG: LVIVD repeat-containing protein, partial [Gemmatimonadales bacterium]